MSEFAGVALLDYWLHNICVYMCIKAKVVALYVCACVFALDWKIPEISK